MTSRNPTSGPAALALALAVLAPGALAAAPAPSSAPPRYAAADWKRLDPETLLVIDTTKGRIIVEMTPQIAPEHVERIKALARQGYYDSLKFFRVIDDFMDQTGDKTNTGAGESDQPPLKGTFNFRRGPETPYVGFANGHGASVGFLGSMPVISQPDELMGLTADGKVKAWGAFCDGVAGMARTSEPDSATTQFFLMRHPYPSLNDRYTPWGRVVVGLDVVRAVAVGEPPANPDVMTRVRVASDLPPAERPNVWRVDPASPGFRAQVEAIRLARGAEFTPCDVEVPAEVRK